jgi:hypothetical protein
MNLELENYVSDYIDSEYFSFLTGSVREYAETLLSDFLRAAIAASSDFPEEADAELFSRILIERTAKLDLPLEVRRGVPGLLGGFFEYLGRSGKYPDAGEWEEWMPGIEEKYLARFREDGSVRGETVRKKFADVGRNDPCPCGSGKKFKKCCISLLT